MYPCKSDYIFTLTIDVRCRGCIMPRIFSKELRAWDHFPEDGNVTEAIAQHIERRCGECIEGCQVDEHNGHFHIFIATADEVAE